MRNNLGKVQKDVADLKEAAVQQETKDKAVNSRLTSVEERLATIEAEPPAPPRPPARGKGSKSPEKTQRKTPEGRPSARVINVPQGEAAPSSAKTEGPPVPLETGSITAEEITFGEVVVTPAAQAKFGVQLGSHASLEGLRERWDRLREQHRGQLAALEPRIVPPRAGGGAYRLLAGPFATKADADRTLLRYWARASPLLRHALHRHAAVGRLHCIPGSRARPLGRGKAVRDLYPSQRACGDASHKLAQLTCTATDRRRFAFAGTGPCYSCPRCFLFRAGPPLHDGAFSP